MNEKIFFSPTLMMFGDEGEGTVNIPETESFHTDKETAKNRAEKSGNSRRKEKVVYGKQEVEPLNTTDSKEDDDLTGDERFEKMIKGEYKEAYDKRVQGLIKHRLGDYKTLEEENASYKKVMDVLSTKYGTGDPLTLLKKLESDNEIWESAAYDAGLTVEQYKTLKHTERERDMFRAEVEARQKEAEARKIYDKWVNEANEVQKLYPSFELSSELQNPEFKSLLKNNIPMKTAYETLHLGELMQGVSEFSAKKAEENTMLNIRSRQMRPRESISGNSRGVVIKDDPSKLTAKDRAEIIRRASNGEKIYF